ncbi:MAG: hypothetical protein NC548_53540 [Lachnospiraceae bacterium]|nr:hypothetical protein [Lachnospiraceae bacterium]
MIKKYITSLFLCFAAAVSALASDYAGWSKYPLFNYEISSMAQGKGKLYYVSNGNLFSFDEDTQETYCYSSLNKLTGDKVHEIYYNFDDDFLLVVYEDANMDVLYDDGGVLNLPEIRDASISASKTVNDVAFSDGMMLIGADFGIVLYDLDKMEVRESGIFNQKVSAVNFEPDGISICTPDKGELKVWYSPMSVRHNNISKFKSISWGLNTDALFSIGDYKYLMRNPVTGDVYTRETNAEHDRWVVNNVTILEASKMPLRPFKEGFYTITDKEFVSIVGGEVRRALLPEDLRGKIASIYDSPAKLWVGGANGVGKYDISNPNSPETLFGEAVPAGVATLEKIGDMRWSADGKRLYIWNRPFSNYTSWGSREEGVDEYQVTNIIEDGFTSDASLLDASADKEDRSTKWQKLHGNKRMYGDPNAVVEDPDDPTIYYCGNNFEGLYVIKYNEQTGLYEEACKFTEANSRIPYAYGYRVEDVNIDPKGNLWVGYLHGYCVLPAEKRRKNPKEVTASDWKTVPKLSGEDYATQDMFSFFCQRSNMAFFFPNSYKGPMVAYDTKGTYDDFTDDVMYTWSRFTDQDGISFEAPLHLTCAIEDSRGCVWVGTTSGIFEIGSPSKATNSDMRVRRMKVARNDGTEYADYLLGNDVIYDMSEDPAGRKWVATEGSGIFLVSETGDEIIRSFNVNNSPLLSNLVTSVQCDPKNNVVYVGTQNGLYSYLSDAAPGTDSLSDILAYPNPVRPEFTGEVTITGLMDNSIVKIADAQGNVIYQTRSQGGMATWNPYTSSGARVRTGVYFIYATSSDGGKQVGGVSKVMVVN